MSRLSLSPSRATLPALCLAGVAVCALFLAVALDSGSGAVPHPPRIDSLVTHQFAKALATGQGYHYTPESEIALPPSHLHAALLSCAWACGLRGDALGVFSFALGALCFLGAIISVRSLFLKIHPRSADTAALFTALSGTTAFAAFLQDETILFASLVLVSFAVLACERGRWLFVLLPAVVLSRPEGVILPAVLCAVLFIPRLRRMNGACTARAASLTAIVLFAFVTAGEMVLTGHPAFPLPSRPPFDLIARTGNHLLDAVKTILFGTGGVRSLLITLPVAGGLLGFLGVLFREEGETSHQPAVTAWIAASVALFVLHAFLTDVPVVPAFSPIVWVVPLWLGCVAMGAHKLERLSGGRLPAMKVAGVLAGVQILGLIGHLLMSADSHARAAANTVFTHRADSLLDDDKRIGTTGLHGAAYFTDSRAFIDITGQVTPSLYGPGSAAWLETVKHDPKLRFDTWLVYEPQQTLPWIAPVLGRIILDEPPFLGAGNALLLAEASWTVLDAAVRPLQPDTLALVMNAKNRARIDVGCQGDEKAAQWHTLQPLPATRFAPFVLIDSRDEGDALEIGRLIMGSEVFTVPVNSDLPLRGVWRTAVAATVPVRSVRTDSMEAVPVLLPTPLEVGLTVDGKPAGTLRIEPHELTPGTVFVEKSFKIPPDLLQNEEAEIAVTGDHLSLCWWFVQ